MESIGYFLQITLQLFSLISFPSTMKVFTVFVLELQVKQERVVTDSFIIIYMVIFLICKKHFTEPMT